MRIAFISQPFDRVMPPSMNSIGIWTYEVARRMAYQNDVTVFTRGRYPTQSQVAPNVRALFIPSLSQHRMGQISSLLLPLTTPKRPFFSSIFYNLEYGLQIALYILKNQYDVVHIQNYSQFIPIIRAFNPHVKIALHMRCEWLTQLDPSLISSRLRQTDWVFGVSDYITNKIRQAFPEHRSQCFTIANGVDTERFNRYDDFHGTDDSNPVILMVGRISPEKGIHDLLQAFRQIGRQYPHAQLKLVGSKHAVNKDFIVGLSEDAQVQGLEIYYQSNYLEKLQSMIPADLKNRVHFEGHVDFYKTIDFYQHSALLVNPSLSESFGRSLIEANACRLPVVAARAGGMTEIIENGYNGLLVSPGNPVELADAVNSLLQDAPLRKQMGMNGRNRVLERYTWDQICTDLANVYRLAVPAPPPTQQILSPHP